VAATSPELWYYRITLNQEIELERAIGPCKGLAYTEAVRRIENVGHAFIDKPRLIGFVMEAAEKAGCIGMPPLVDGRLISSLRPGSRR